MGRFRALVAQSPAIAISIVAVVLSIGGGAYASTQLAAGQPVPAVTSGVSWSPLPLVNGWNSENAAYGSGNPKYAIQSNIVYLSGSLGQATPGSNQFSTLPTGFRPTHNMWITVYTFGGTFGTLYIGKDGTMDLSSGGKCGTNQTDAECYSSLATVSFPINS